MAKKRANGEGNIRKRKDGRWEGRYTAGYDEKTGKRIIKSVLGKTQAEAKEKLAKAIAEAETLDAQRVDEYTLGTWLQTWYELYAKPHLRFSTAEYYRRGIELHITPRLGDIPLKKLTGRDLQWLYKDLQEHGRLREAQKGKQPGLSDSTIRGIHTMLHNALDRAVKERLISAVSCPCSIWNSLADCARENWLRCNGQTWISKTRPSLSVNRQGEIMQANPTSRARKRKTLSEKSQYRRMQSVC